MTEAEWLTCTDPRPMLDCLKGKVSSRKLRLFACACCRALIVAKSNRPSRVIPDLFQRFLPGTWNVLREPSWDAVLEHCERRTDGEATQMAHPVALAFLTLTDQIPILQLLTEAARETSEGGPATAAAQANLLRDVASNPFRPVTVDQAWLTWNGGTVAHLAAAAYDARELPRGTLDNGRLAVLADALEEAGCDDRAMLDHCRQPGEHVRGCWLVDLVLGKS